MKDIKLVYCKTQLPDDIKSGTVYFVESSGKVYVGNDSGEAINFSGLTTEEEFVISKAINNLNDRLSTVENVELPTFKTINGQSVVGSGDIYIRTTGVLDSLGTDYTEYALSAKQGKVLNGKITSVSEDLNSYKTTTDTKLEEIDALSESVESLNSNINTVSQTVEDNSLVVAAALNDLNDRVAEVENKELI